MAATTGGAVITDTQLDEWMTERGVSVEDIQRAGSVQREFIDFLDTQRGREIIPPDPVGPQPGEPLGPVTAPPVGPTRAPALPRVSLPSLSGVTGGVASAVASALSGPFGVIADIVAGITGQIRTLAEATIPTISELALGIVSGVGNALDFIGDNLVEVSDFAGAMASALITPLEALAEVVGERMRDFILGVIGLIFRALGGLKATLPELTMERPI